MLGGVRRRAAAAAATGGACLDSEWLREQGSSQAFAGYYLDEVAVAADRFRIPPRELQEMLPQQVLMLLVADAALPACRCRTKIRPRTGVFIGLGLDLNTTNFTSAGRC